MSAAGCLTPCSPEIPPHIGFELPIKLQRVNHTMPAKQETRAVWITAVLCTAAVLTMLGVMLSIFLQGANTPPAPMEFSPPAFDSAAVTGTPSVPANRGYTPIEVEQGYRVFLCGEPQAIGDSAEVYFTSPTDNTVWLKLKLSDTDGNVLGETGVIKPGEYVQNMKLYDIPTASVAVKLTVIAYQPDTWYSMGTVGLNTNLIIQ